MAGEVERPIIGAADWTRDWDWVLSLALCSAGNPREITVVAVFYFRDLPRQFNVNNPRAWGDAAVTDSAETYERMLEDEKLYWGYYKAFCHLAKDPEWSGWVCTKHKSRGWLIRSDPLGLLSTPGLAVEKAELDQRTGPGRYKKAMWYRPGVGYANDLDGHPMAT